MPNMIGVRDVVRNATYELHPDEPILFVPYDLFQPSGAVRTGDGLITWTEGKVARSGRAVRSTLRNAEVGVRVLVRIPTDASHEDEWWLCEVAVVDGVAGNLNESSHERNQKSEAP
jgi:hypothetical protein